MGNGKHQGQDSARATKNFRKSLAGDTLMQRSMSKHKSTFPKNRPVGQHQGQQHRGRERTATW